MFRCCIGKEDVKQFYPFLAGRQACAYLSVVFWLRMDLTLSQHNHLHNEQRRKLERQAGKVFIISPSFLVMLRNFVKQKEQGTLLTVSYLTYFS